MPRFIAKAILGHFPEKGGHYGAFEKVSPISLVSLWDFKNAGGVYGIWV
jgi:hypothetical protein